MGRVNRSIIKYVDENDPKTRYVDLPKIIKEDYSFEMMFGYNYPSTGYNTSTGIKSRPFHGTIKDSYYKSGN